MNDKGVCRKAPATPGLLKKCILLHGHTHTQMTHGHRDLETKSAQWANSVKIMMA